MISGFRRGVNEISLFWDVTQIGLTVINDVSGQPMGSHFQGTSNSRPTLIYGTRYFVSKRRQVSANLRYVISQTTWGLSVNNQSEGFFFYVWLAVHLSIFISVFNQLDAQNLFHNKFYFIPLHVSSTCAHHQEVKIVLHSLWYHHTYRWPSRARVPCSLKMGPHRLSRNVVNNCQSNLRNIPEERNLIHTAAEAWNHVS